MGVLRVLKSTIFLIALVGAIVGGPYVAGVWHVTSHHSAVRAIAPLPAPAFGTTEDAYEPVRVNRTRKGNREAVRTRPQASPEKPPRPYRGPHLLFGSRIT